jgi:hypothetical protein
VRRLGARGAFVILGLDMGRSPSPAGAGRSPGKKYLRLSSKQSIRGTLIRTCRTPLAALGMVTMATMLGIMAGTLFPTPRSVNRRDGAGRRRQGGCGRCTFDFPIADYTATAGWRPRPPFALLGLG